ncbi:MAG: hypothetical protein SOW50_03515 [Lachnospiraceae bacterium]|nr:hypothetical protein [Lachnospiraceae bacterium]
MKNHFLVSIIGDDAAAPDISGFNGRAHHAVLDRRKVLIPLCFAGILGCWWQNSPAFIEDLAVFGAAAAQAVFPVGLDDGQLVLAPKDQLVFKYRDFSHKNRSFSFLVSRVHRHRVIKFL